jgi:hypothetical protein
MSYHKYAENPEYYLFRFVLVDHVEEYIGQGWEVVGMMQNMSIAINSVTSYIMVLEI